MLGYTQLDQGDEQYNALDQGMKEVNHQLGKYSDWHDALDAAIIIGVKDSSIVYQWRDQQEENLRLAGKGAMTKE